MVKALIEDAVGSGCRRALACETLEISLRTYQRWTREGNAGKEDGRKNASRVAPANKLSDEERMRILALVNSAEFASQPPSQIVPTLVDRGEYLASESTFYRVLKTANQNVRRGRTKAPKRRVLTTHRADSPNQVWCWDITWLPSTVKGRFFYWYMVKDVYSRKLVANEVHEVECAEHACELLRKGCLREHTAGRPLVLHTLAAFAAVPRICQTAIVVASDDEFFQSHFASFLIADCGGPTRASSVFNGLVFLLQCGAEPDDWVLVHDAARCLITPAQINALIDACAGDAVGGLLAHKLPDTLKSEVGGRVAATLERSDKWLAQTPQMFRLGALIEALQQAGDQVTDESSAMEQMGLQPLLVPGSAQNFKVTYPEDFALAEAVLNARIMLRHRP